MGGFFIVFITVFIAGFIIAAFLGGGSDTGALAYCLLYGVAVIAGLLYVIKEKLDKILSIIDKD